jgi:hypothetical protein
MWYETLDAGRSWTHLITAHILCGCGGIRQFEWNCPACDSPPPSTAPFSVVDESGKVHEVVPAFCGAEGRCEDYELLGLIEREWKRSASSGSEEPRFGSAMSNKANVVLLFWTYFETRINRLVGVGLRDLPAAVSADLLARYDSVTSRMGRLYEILFSARYADDLLEVGAESVAGHLARIKDVRNRFVHGSPSAISDGVVEAVVRQLKEEHDAWIAVYNLRIRRARDGRPNSSK